MGLAITIAVLGIAFAIALAAGLREFEPVVSVIMVTIMATMILSLAPLNYPSSRDAPYNTTVDGQELYFSNYTIKDSTLDIPTHYYRKTGFINSWELCDNPITIAYSDGNAQKYISARTPDDPYIKTGAVECH